MLAFLKFGLDAKYCCFFNFLFDWYIYWTTKSTIQGKNRTRLVENKNVCARDVT
jgi:hypothetical protein